MGRIIGKEMKCFNNLMKRYFCSSPLMRECESLTGMHSYVLGYLYHRGMECDVFQRDIENEFEMRRSTASGILKLMEENGLIVRESVESDARLKKIVLTDKAKDLNAKISAEFAEVENALCEGISDGEFEVFYSVLDAMKKNLTDKLNGKQNNKAK